MGQGAVESCVIWNAVYDILLTALRLIRDRSDPLFFRDGFTLRTISAAAFADDLIALASTVAGMQLISDVVSAFTIVFGFDIRVDKLRTLFLQWGTAEKYVHEPTLTVR